MASVGNLEVFEKRTAMLALATVALLAFALFVTFGPWVVSHPAPAWWIGGRQGFGLARAEARWEGMQTLGWVAIVASPLMLAGLAFAIWRLIKHRPVLRIDEQGVWCGGLKKLGIIPWSDIEGAFIATGGLSGQRIKIKFLCLRLRNLADYRSRVGTPHRLARDHLHLPDFHLMGMMGATPSAPEVEAFINDAIARRRGASPDSG